MCWLEAVIVKKIITGPSVYYERAIFFTENTILLRIQEKEIVQHLSQN